MFKLIRQRSFFVTVLLFWFFSTLPRIWYYVEEGILTDSVVSTMATLAMGFVQDGVLIAGLLFFFQVFHRWIFRLPHKLIDWLHSVVGLLFAFILAVMMANVEFFRYFGSNANLTHFSFVSDSEILIPSLQVIFPITKVLFALILVPSAYFFLTKMVGGWTLSHYLQRRLALLIPLLLAAAGLAATSIWEEKDEIKKNLQTNYVLSFLNYAFTGDDIKGQSSEPLEKILDTHPLKSAQIKSPDWHYVDPKYPLIQATAHDLCQMNLWDKKACDRDEDMDGYPLKKDCNDGEGGINPGANDIPGNSLDEDCSGMDADPPNIIFIHWEGARAVNVGSIGYSSAVTPRFDAMSKKGRLFKNAYANGTQTRWSLTSVYNSILPRLSTKWIFKHNKRLNLLSFPGILRSYGYHTLYIHSGDINFGSLKSKFWEWFETMYDKKNQPIKSMKKLGWGIRDKQLFDFSYQVLKERKDPRPFYLTIATLSLHHPFHLPDGKHALFPHTSMANRYRNILHYCDEQLADFVEKVLADPQFKNTVILIAADHGMNAGSPHKTWSQSTLWEDLVWVPVLLMGPWNIPPGIDDEVRQLADIGPTILDRLGIEVPNHFIGHSLLKSYGPGREGVAFFGNANGGPSAGLRMGKYKYRISFESKAQYLYDVSSDREEKINLANKSEFKGLREKFYKMVTDVYVQHTKLIKENRVWNWKYGMKSKKTPSSK